MNKPLLAVLLAIAGVSGALAAGIETEDLGGGGGGGGSGDVTASATLTENAFVVGDSAAKGVKTISASTARSTLNVEDGAAADQAASEFEAGGATPLTLENIPGSASTGDFWVGAASGRATPVSSGTVAAGLAGLLSPAAHASTHSDGGSDELTVEDLATSCTSGQVLKGDGAGGLACGTDDTGGGSSPALLVGTWTEYTISAGSINVTSGVHFVHIDTESDAAADDLDTIQVGGGSPAGAYILFVNPENDARTVDVTSAGNIDPSGAGTSDASSVSLNTDQRSMILIYDPDQSQWETYGVQF